MKLFRALLPPLIDRGSGGAVPAADRAMAETDTSGLVGPGGLAAEK